MQRTDTLGWKAAAAMALPLGAAHLPNIQIVTADAAQSATSSTVARSAAAMAGNSHSAATIEQAFWLRAGRSTRRRGYPRPGDSVRQHARKAARRRNQVRARRAARG